MNSKIQEIRFSTNWNNKLYCNIFSTLRFGLCSFKIGDEVNILLRKSGAYVSTGNAKVINVYKDVNFRALDWYLPLDTGYSFEESWKLFTQFNSNIQIDDNTTINVIILQRINSIILNKI
jgi:hypothetical protein